MIQSSIDNKITDKNKLKILTWNIRHGGTKYTLDKIIQSLIFHNADVVVLTEFRNNDNDFNIVWRKYKIIKSVI
ncbi:hypothetical protein J43TS3_25950 [Ornithinibacillus bavariensis]|uniref:Endonuclease/exonuclease/phosphatase domain-containing protein n=2 Tax=Ornithinibacillus bavariensis TaxID=545502 RepID=A0A920C898_9BACI|nr:hypothetical protein J43TS3_25950 [Ornithinibacillus bavariensis]